MSSFAAARRNMVDCQLRTFDVSDRAVLAAMGELPRELFSPPAGQSLAYLDRTVTLSGDADDARVMLAPMLLARLVQALEIQASSRALDVGGGLGYSAALLARLGAQVTLLEPRTDLADAARQGLARLDLGRRVTFASGPLEAGAAEHAPFDAILIDGAVEDEPSALLRQLVDGGRLACVVGAGSGGKACIFLRSGDSFGRRTLFDAAAPVLAAFRRAPAFTF